MNKWFLLGLCVLFCRTADASSFRCGRKLVKVGESSNALVRKCGAPARKYSAREKVSEHGRQRDTTVSNWVYKRSGKKDMIVSVRGGTVVRMQVD
ncbi:MAG: DUF2845 domain-containing protein [Xanthomonadales bacterium]|nr:DUF2845 domain-containing protein [Xanthomonadales bacterium]